jgi:hypothetical protein
MNLLDRIERLERLAPNPNQAAYAARVASMSLEELRKARALMEIANSNPYALTDEEKEWLIATLNAGAGATVAT